MVRVNDITQIPARDEAGHRQVFHHYLPDRRSQTRGVTAFAPMADTADHWDDLGILAVNLDLPLCLFLLDASETNYSGFRGAIDQARQQLPYIQPVDDATADILQAKGLLSSPRRLAASRGIDFGDLTEEIVADHGARIEKAHAEIAGSPQPNMVVPDAAPPTRSE